ncbi:MAG: DUF255 domain-containing protein [Armatimonadetes bacterium]|nr:DUF255 domain-containing protein [Armatimonadota bacterium]MBS1711894.1 DUF255 domain-containing protein [Armatimonadota bacterium]MBX3109552.1 DUF255 domain-containing protein [Fimbriimonadaceae bacterium]
MRAFKRLFSALVLTVAAVSAFAAQTPAESTVESGKVTWTAKLKDADTRVGETTQILVTGKLPAGWHTYGPQIDKGDFIKTSIKSDLDGNVAEPAGDPLFPAAHIVFDEGFQIPVAVYSGEFTIAVPVRIIAAPEGSTQIQVQARAQACDDSGCDSPKNAILGIDFTAAAGEPRPDRIQPDLAAPDQPAGYAAPPDAESTANASVLEAALAGKAPGAESQTTGTPVTPSGTQEPAADDATSKGIAEAKAQGLLPFFLFSFAAGLLALLTPCVWPMIPITVSYFTKKAEEGPGAVVKYAVAYCLGIMVTFVGLGLIVTSIAGATGVQRIAASPVANGFLALLFIALALNLFGVFEIQVPAKFVNQIQGKTKVAGLAAPILLGFVFSLTTFTCTVPFVGTILVSSTTGDMLYPVVGMLGFSLAFALPFFLLAMVPNALKKLPKSGTWLNSVKAYMGFLELAAAMKFVSNMDVIVNERLWLPFAGFGAIWITIFVVAALYLFGLVKMPHDDGSKVGTGRRLFGVFNVLVAVWLMAGFSNAQVLGPLIGFYPPTPSGWSEDLEGVKTRAAAEGKPIFINFTGKTCTNCRVMEYQKFPTEAYRKELAKFALAELYTDRETPADNANAEYREKLTKSSTNPTYAIIKPDGTLVGVYQGLAKSDKDFLDWMRANYTKALQ